MSSTYEKELEIIKQEKELQDKQEKEKLEKVKLKAENLSKTL